jgi:hypothetical protein
MNIDLQWVKEQLRVTHNADDSLITRLTESAEQECLRFLNRTELPTLPYELPIDSDGCPTSEEMPSSEDPVADDVINGILLLVQQDYEGAPEDRAASRRAAEGLFWPYRTSIGV